jgi:hypothetical protein
MALEKHWLTVEYMVGLLERSLSPESNVQQNVHLPDLTSNIGNTRQCDIVITSGTKPRETKTIVEVQNRKDKVEINDFQGWVSKMRDVGAQQLFCVSTTGFPVSIIEKARTFGGTVRLITLKLEDTKTLPIKIFSFKQSFNNYRKTIHSVKFTGIDDKSRKQLRGHKIHFEEKVFYYPNNQEKKSALDLLNAYLNKHGYEFEGQSETEFPGKDSKLLMDLDGKQITLKLKCNYSMKKEVIEGDSNVYNYEQLGDGTLAWLLTSECKVGNISYTASLPATPNSDGTFVVRYLDLLIKPILNVET